MSHVSDLLNQDRADAVLKDGGFDAVLAASPENWVYLTGLEDAVASTIGLPTLALLTRKPLGVQAIAIPRLIAGFAAAQLHDVDDVLLYGEFPVNVGAAELRGLERATAALLADRRSSAPTVGDAAELILQRAGLERGRIAIDDLSIAQLVRERVPTCDCIAGQSVMERIRSVKTPEEISRLGAAATIVEELEQLAFDHASPGRVWDDFIPNLPVVTAQRGARLGFFSGGAGWRSGFMFPAMEEALNRGDLIRLDISISHRGYWADSGRSASVGPPSEEVTQRYQAIRLAVESALEAVRPGVAFAEIYEVAMRVAGQQIPNYRRRHCGHTIGLRPYDGLLVAPEESTRLEVGMVLNVEVPYYGIGWGGLQLEDTVIVTETGCEPLTRLTHDLITVGES